MDIYEKYKKIEDLPIATTVQEPKTNKNLVGVIHILHGMCEHKGRYKEMMNFFSSHGYICVISDMRGHGENVEYIKDLGYFGENGADLLVEDVHAVNVYIHNIFPDLPVILVAHSMGSVVGRAFLKKYDADVDCVFLSGSPSDSLAKYIGFLISELQSLVFEDTDNSRILDYYFSGRLKNKFSDEDNNSWLCKDKEIIEKYNNDEKCSFTFKINGYNALFRLMIRIYSRRGWAVKNSRLPIYVIAGSEDVFAGNEKKIRQQLRLLKSVGYENVKYHTFEGMRHEIFNEPDHMLVWKYMLSKLKKRL